MRTCCGSFRKWQSQHRQRNHWCCAGLQATSPLQCTGGLQPATEAHMHEQGLTATLYVWHGTGITHVICYVEL